jgi:hypothetical protein
MATFNENVRVNGTVTADGVYSDSATITNSMIATSAAIAGSKLAQGTNRAFALPLESWEIHNAHRTVLTATANTDDLGYIPGTFATASPKISAGDLKAAGATTRYARRSVYVPGDYEDGETLTLRFWAGMLTTIADNTCTLDVSAYLSDGASGIGADLISTAATDINSTSLANIDFLITPTGLVAGSKLLDVRIAIACNDAATGTVVEPIIGLSQLLVDTRG